MNALGNMRASHCGKTSTSGRQLQHPPVLPQFSLRSQHHVQQRHSKHRAVRTSAKRGSGTATTTEDKAGKGRTAEIVDESPIILERGAPAIPRPGQFQQTLQRSFTLGGLGLHTAEYATVCVKPACANEGRYFVRVPEGTNQGKFEIQEPKDIDIRDSGPLDLGPDGEDAKMALFAEYLEAEEQEKFEGSFQDFLHAIDREDLVEQFEADPNFMKKAWEEQAREQGVEAIQPRGSDEEVVPAHISSVPTSPQAVALSLGEEAGEPGAIIGAELLLATLECCGVDNARIEIEGGRELPVLDGSALGWAMEVQFAGLRLAPEASSLGQEQEASAEEPMTPVERLVASPQEVITVREADGFITLVPEDTMRQTVGLDCAASAPVIGKQWLSWCMFEDPHFRMDLASARRYMESPEEVLALHSMGWVQGGTEGVMLVGFGERWYDATLTRFVRDEPVRHEMCNLLGLLSLSAEPGHAGIPVGHVVQYKATLELQLKFVRELKARLSDEDYVPIAFNLEEDAEEAGEEEEEEGEVQE
uniref:UDP-3-O-acyl-N-acetylglucosamine deacetylase n=1 Tax=Dunaliella tertiolecta TaxID=3047 RepID=A0A7S3R5S0_DUNTE|mmetsp:Transcript_1308/g.3136  ORF Transcript_1308/g.3136 Transcript_1308/m.3136 type:complete len:532 (+) Transcript_1308:459-2054(+)